MSTIFVVFSVYKFSFPYFCTFLINIASYIVDTYPRYKNRALGNFSISSGKLDDDIATFLKKYGKN